MKVIEYLLQTIKTRANPDIFGVVGREAQSVTFQEVPGINFVLCRDERSAAFMAEVQGRLTGRCGVCYSTFGPGAVNLATGISSAWLDRSPLLAISAQVESACIHPHTHQCVDQVALMRPITNYAVEITSAADIPQELNAALDRAVEGVPGPVFLSIPFDLFEQEIPADAAGIPADDLKRRSSEEAEGLEALQEILEKAKAPIFLIGNGLGKRADLNGLGEFLKSRSVPFVVSYGGKGRLPANHPCCLGTVSKYWDDIALGLLDEIFNDRDCVVLWEFDQAGGLDSRLWARGREKRIIAVNSLIDEKMIGCRVEADIRSSTEDIVGALESAIDPRRFDPAIIDQRKSAVRGMTGRVKAKARSSFETLSPLAVIDVMNDVLRNDDIVVSDVGLHKQLVSLFYDSQRPGTFLGSNGLGCMGFGLPAAIGAKRTRPQSRVVAVCGDGGFHFSSHELETAKRYGLPVVCLVFCDQSVGLIRHYQNKGGRYPEPSVTDFGPVDFVRLAQANGCQGEHIKNEEHLRRALASALDSEDPTVLQINYAKEKYLWLPNDV